MQRERRRGEGRRRHGVGESRGGGEHARGRPRICATSCQAASNLTRRCLASESARGARERRLFACARARTSLRSGRTPRRGRPGQNVATGSIDCSAAPGRRAGRSQRSPRISPSVALLEQRSQHAAGLPGWIGIQEISINAPGSASDESLPLPWRPAHHCPDWRRKRYARSARPERRARYDREAEWTRPCERAPDSQAQAVLEFGYLWPLS